MVIVVMSSNIVAEVVGMSCLRARVQAVWAHLGASESLRCVEVRGTRLRSPRTFCHIGTVCGDKLACNHPHQTRGNCCTAGMAAKAEREEGAAAGESADKPSAPGERGGGASGDRPDKAVSDLN